MRKLFPGMLFTTVVSCLIMAPSTQAAQSPSVKNKTHWVSDNRAGGKLRGPVTINNNGILLGGVGRRGTNFLWSTKAYDHVGHEFFTKFMVDVANTYAYLYLGPSGIPAKGYSTRNAYKASKVLPQRQWLYHRSKIAADGTWEIVTSTGNYDTKKGRVLHRQNGKLNASQLASMKRFKFLFGFTDTYAGGQTSMKIAEVSSSPVGGAKVVGKDIRQSIDGAKLKAALKARSAKSVKSRIKIAKLAAQKRSDAQMIQCAGDMGGKIGREGIVLPEGTSIGDAALDVCKLAGFDSKLAAKKLVEFYPKVRPATKQDKIDCTTDVILQITADKMNLYGKKRADVAWDACEANQFVPVRAYAALEKERPSLDNCAVDVAFKAASGKLFLPAGKNRVDMAAVACKSNGNKVNAAYTKLAADYPSTVTCVAYLNREHKKKVLNVGESKRVRTFMDACAQNGNQYKAAKAKLLPIYGPHPSCVTAVLLKGHQIRVRYEGDPATKVAEFCKKNGDQAGKAYSAVREALPNAFKDCITPLILRASFTKNPETLKVGLADQCRKHKLVSAKVYDDWKKKHWTLACQDRVIDQVKKLGVKGSGWKIPTSAFVKPDIWHRAEDACIFNKNRMASLKRSGTDTSFMVRTEWKSLDPQYGTYK